MTNAIIRGVILATAQRCSPAAAAHLAAQEAFQHRALRLAAALHTTAEVLLHAYAAFPGDWRDFEASLIPPPNWAAIEALWREVEAMEDASQPIKGAGDE